MKHYLDILNKKKLWITIYILLGVILALLNSFSASYFQKVLDDFGDKTFSITTLFIYGIVLVIVCVINYFDEYPSCKLSQSIYLNFKLKALRKMSTIDYRYYQSLGTGNLIQKIENGACAGKKHIITIAHRLNTIKDFNKIYVFKNGEIVGEGGFKELLENNQYFKKLWNVAIEK